MVLVTWLPRSSAPRNSKIAAKQIACAEDREEELYRVGVGGDRELSIHHMLFFVGITPIYAYSLYK